MKQQILDYLSRSNYRPIKPKELAKKIGIKKKNMPQFKAALAELADAGKVKRGKSGQVRIATAPGLIEGIIKKTASGAGYLIPHEQPGKKPITDVYIAPADLADAHTGDEVLVQLLKRRRSGGQRCGRVDEILERATHRFVGTYFERAGQGLVQVDGTAISDPVAVGDPGAKGAQPQDKVVVEMLRFPSHLQPGEAVLTEVLGPQGKPGVDTLTIIHEFGLPDEFPDDVLDDARQRADQFDESDLSNRHDLTNQTIVTIDPVDARDFDDAISLTKNEAGNWRLGVHIADVSHFVPEGSLLDLEARKRGTSVYLPGRVLPMLPEIISNGLASLQQGRVRFSKSVFIEFTPDGVPLHTEFAASAIKVTRRFAYEEVLDILQGKPPKKRLTKNVQQLLSDMQTLAMLLRKRRFAAGALELTLPEVKLDLGKKGEVTGAHTVPHDESHQIIEEFMLAANIAVATHFDDRAIPVMRRVHGEPSSAKLSAFRNFVKALGFQLERPQSRHALQELLDKVEGKPASQAINYALLRSMKQAEYTGRDLGHYALAVENYCHFTSPIRRYPDLVVHRMIESFLGSSKKVSYKNEYELTKLGKLCSGAERRAATAERELTKIKLLNFMAERIGTEFDANITGVERFGLFCQGREIPVDGFIHVSWLGENDVFYFDDAAISLIGRRTGKQYRLGDKIRVKVAHVDLNRRELDLHLAPRSTTGKSKPRTTKGRKTSGRKTDSRGAKTGGRKKTGKSAPTRSKKKNSAGSSQTNRGNPRRKRKKSRRRS